MICLEVHHQGSLLCRAGLPNASTLSARVHALARNPHAPASLHISGKSESPEEVASHFCWNDSLPLGKGDRIRFSLVESDEPFASTAVRPVAGQEKPGPSASAGSAQPARKTWPNVSMKLSVNGVRLVRAALGLGQEQILCAVQWDPNRPEHLKALAHSSTGPGSEPGQPRQTEWLHLNLLKGDVLEIEVDA